MLKTTIAGKPYEIPESISDLTLGQYLALKQPNLSSLQQLGIIMANDINAFAGLVPSESIDRQVSNAALQLTSLNQSIEAFKLSNEKVTPPSSITLDGLTIEVPKDVKPEPYGAYMYAKPMFIAIAEDVTKSDEYMVDILAHYLYRPYMRKLTKDPNEQYSQYHAENFKEVVKQLPLDTAQRLNAFFLTRSKLLYKSRWQRYQVRLTLWLRQLAYRISTSSVT